MNVTMVETLDSCWYIRVSARELRTNRNTKTVQLSKQSEILSIRMEEMLSIRLPSIQRFEDQEGTDSPGSDGGGAGESAGSDAPTPAPSTEPSSNSSGSSPILGFGWFVLSLLIIATLVVAWCWYGRCRKRREQRMVDSRSRQADQVLGDMQMVPNADLDNELI
jgi:hypothetical protein